MPWEHISIDLIGPLPPSSGYDAILVIVDRFSKYIIVLPTNMELSAFGTAQIYRDHVWSQFGLPRKVISDRGPQFAAQFMRDLHSLTGVESNLSTAYHPQTDGQTEIANQYLDQRLRPFVNYFQDNWAELLPMMDYANATLPHSSTGFAPIELEMGYLPRTSFDWNRPMEPQTIWEKLSREEA